MPFIIGAFLGMGLVELIFAIIGILFFVFFLLPMMLIAVISSWQKKNVGGYTYSTWTGADGKVYSSYMHPSWKKPKISCYTPYPPGANFFQRVWFDLKLFGKQIAAFFKAIGKGAAAVWHGITAVWKFMCKLCGWIATGVKWLWSFIHKHP